MGLVWDFREPYDGFYKVWKMLVILEREGYECDIVFNFSPEIGGYQSPLPDGWVCRLDTDGEINAENYLNLSLYEYDLDHKGDPGGDPAIIDTVIQTGEYETWYIIAGIPEPAVVQLGGLVLGAAWILQRLRRRWRGLRIAVVYGCTDHWPCVLLVPGSCPERGRREGRDDGLPLIR